MLAIDTPHLTLRELERALATTDPGVLLAAPRILRRVIRSDRRLTTFGWEVPHRKSYVIARERLFDLVSRFELELEFDRDLPEMVILLERPIEEDLAEQSPAQLLAEYSRLLFHIRIHTEFDRLIAAEQLTDETVLDRLRQLGSTTFAEIRAVLQRESMILPPRTDLSTYVEFAAVFLELRYFSPEQLAWWFPGLRDPEAIGQLLARDVHHEAIYDATRLPGGADRIASVRMEDEEQQGLPLPSAATDPLHPSPPVYWRLIARAEKIGSVGNVVKAAILRTKAARQALPDRAQESTRLAQAELERLARRLQPVLELSAEETREWADALAPLLDRAHQGLRAAEAKLLYDLQKVCVEHERGVYKLDLIEWAINLGRVPIKRPLPLLRQVLVTKHLLSAARKLTLARLSGPARTRLSNLIAAAVDRAKHSLRDRLRPQIADVLAAKGLRPANVPERVAFRKIVEELLDRIVQRGHLNFGQLRDTLSQNHLKLPDLTSLWELLTGDLLLRIDTALADTLDGVYHRGPIYLRWSQRLSAMAFGTGFGRWLTRYAALPYGGAYLLLESFRHVAHLFVPKEPSETSSPDFLSRVLPGPTTVAQIAVLGTFLWFLIHRAGFRQLCVQVLRKSGQGLRRLLYDWPMSVLHWPWVRRLLDSPLYVVVVNYGFKPLAVTTVVLLPFEIRFAMVTWVTWSIAFLIINLLVNSPLGRYADEVITENVLRGWRELQIRVFAAALRAIIDLFQWVLQTIEKLLYTVDEWLRFRTGESWFTLLFKGVVGAVWAVIAYVVRIYITLLIEPQVNPIKHFPVVTVSHKMMLPFIGHLTKIVATPLAPLGTFWSTTIAGTTVFLLPGVFGFLVWELKENWRLYASNRSKNLRPIRIGSHGETLLRFLRMGFHSGTVPKLYGKLRYASRKALRTGKWSTVRRHRDALHHVEESIQYFVERELLNLLDEARDWCGISLKVGEVQLSTNRIAVSLLRAGDDSTPLILEFQERFGWIIAAVNTEGWLANLAATDREMFWRGLTGLFKSAGVDILWQDVMKFAGFESTWYDVSPDGILFWPHPHQHQAVLYRLRETGVETPWPVPIRAVVEPSLLERPQLIFSATPLSWADWVAMWNGSHAEPEGASREVAEQTHS
jgi:hypothetical protein